jgi:hypothetical protein
VYTTFTIEVAAGKVTITASSDNSWNDVKYVSANVATTGRKYYLYLSNPYLDFNSPNQNEFRPSAGGWIRNIVFTGEFRDIRCYV